jgi:hypothetical protein
LVGSDDSASLFLLVLKGLEVITKSSSPSLLLVVKSLIKIQKRGGIQTYFMLFLLLAVFSGFHFHLSSLISSKMNLPLPSSSSDAQIRTQGLPFQQSPKHPGLVRRFLQEHQVLNLSEGHHSLDPLLWETILEDSKLKRVLGVLVTEIHEDIQLDTLRLVRVRPNNLVQRNGGGGKEGMGILRIK